MKKAMFGILLGGLGLLGASSSGAKKLHRGATPSILPGELIRLEAKIGEVKGGHSYLFAKQVKHARSGTHIHATMKARTNLFFDKIHRINNKFTSQFQLRDASPFTYHLDVDQAGNVLKRQIAFQPAGHRGQLKLDIQYQKLYGKTYVRRFHQKLAVPSNTHNLVSAFYHARFLPYHVGQQYSFHVFVTGRLWHVEGKLLRKEYIYTILGKKRALLLQAKARRLHQGAKARTIQVWLSDDAQRIPLKILGYVPYVGAATAELSGYRRSLHSRYMDGSHRSKRKRGGRWWDILSQF